MDILKEFYILRLKMYQKRKDFLEGILEAEAAKLSNQARFIMEKCSGQLVVENKKRKTIVDELLKKGYAPDPVKEWKRSTQAEEEEEEVPDEDTQDEEQQDENAKKKAASNLPEASKFDYLLGMSMWMLTEERKNDLLRQKDAKLHELETLKKKTNKDLWREDLDAFSEKLDIVEEKERNEEIGKPKDAKKGVTVSCCLFIVTKDYLLLLCAKDSYKQAYLQIFVFITKSHGYIYFFKLCVHILFKSVNNTYKFL